MASAGYQSRVSNFCSLLPDLQLCLGASGDSRAGILWMSANVMRGSVQDDARVDSGCQEGSRRT